jgi:hypothetical protein
MTDAARAGLRQALATALAALVVGSFHTPQAFLAVLLVQLLGGIPCTSGIELVRRFFLLPQAHSAASRFSRWRQMSNGFPCHCFSLHAVGGRLLYWDAMVQLAAFFLEWGSWRCSQSHLFFRRGI